MSSNSRLSSAFQPTSQYGQHLTMPIQATALQPPFYFTQHQQYQQVPGPLSSHYSPSFPVFSAPPPPPPSFKEFSDQMEHRLNKICKRLEEIEKKVGGNTHKENKTKCENSVSTTNFPTPAVPSPSSQNFRLARQDKPRMRVVQEMLDFLKQPLPVQRSQRSIDTIRQYRRMQRGLENDGLLAPGQFPHTAQLPLGEIHHYFRKSGRKVKRITRQNRISFKPGGEETEEEEEDDEEIDHSEE